MKSTDIKVVIIENHPLILEMYHSVLGDLESSCENWSFNISEAIDYENSLILLNSLSEIDLVFLDLNISDFERDSHTDGFNLGKKIRVKFPKAKIMVLADYKNNYHINIVLRYIKPEGFLVMTDLNKQILLPAITDVLVDPPFYSKKILKSLRKSKGHNFILDEWDERLLYELSRGTKMKDLPSILPLSLRAIEKRKQNIKSLFGITGGDNRQLLEKVREYGFI